MRSPACSSSSRSSRGSCWGRSRVCVLAPLIFSYPMFSPSFVHSAYLRTIHNPQFPTPHHSLLPFTSTFHQFTEIETSADANTYPQTSNGRVYRPFIAKGAVDVLCMVWRSITGGVYLLFRSSSSRSFGRYFRSSFTLVFGVRRSCVRVGVWCLVSCFSWGFETSEYWVMSSRRRVPDVGLGLSWFSVFGLHC